ncbi:MAG: hypothetical protein LBI67_07970 [Treponema sp.]|nr:hypothetical protein [Treponema sp.]
MITKKFGILFFVFIPVILCYSQNFIGWPSADKIPSRIIIDYVDGKQNLSKKELKREYNYILQFLVEAIDVHKNNIFNRFNPSYFTKKRPVLLSDKLDFESISGGCFIWDRKEEIVREMADVDGGDEAVDLICAIKTYNLFVDYWYMKTGEILQDKFDIEKEINGIIQFEESLKNEEPVSKIP